MMKMKNVVIFSSLPSLNRGKLLLTWQMGVREGSGRINSGRVEKEGMSFELK
jgi:hypothetical protein